MMTVLLYRAYRDEDGLIPVFQRLLDEGPGELLKHDRMVMARSLSAASAVVAVLLVTLRVAALALVLCRLVVSVVSSRCL